MRGLLVALCALAIGGVAYAQQDEDQLGASAVGFSIKLGGYFPADEELRDLKTTFIEVGLEYDLERSWLRNGTTYLSGQWISDKFLGGQHVLDLTINQRIYTENQRFAAGGSPYFFGGIGVSLFHFPGADDETTWVIRGGIGSEFQGDYFVEVGGYLSPEKSGINTSGISASLGYRFKG